jgi:hypothetical protein
MKKIIFVFDCAVRRPVVASQEYDLVALSLRSFSFLACARLISELIFLIVFSLGLRIWTRFRLQLPRFLSWSHSFSHWLLSPLGLRFDFCFPVWILPPVDSRPRKPGCRSGSISHRCLHPPTHLAIFARLGGDALLDWLRLAADCFCRFDLRSQGRAPACQFYRPWSSRSVCAQAWVRLCHFLSDSCRVVLVSVSFSQIWFCSSAIVVRGGFPVLFLAIGLKSQVFLIWILLLR